MVAKKDLRPIRDILATHDFVDRFANAGKYVKEEYQDFGLRLAEKLGDHNHKSLYILLAKDLPRDVLEKVCQFALDYPNKFGENRGRIFTWRLKEVCAEKKIPMPVRHFKKKVLRISDQFSLLTKF